MSRLWQAASRIPSLPVSKPSPEHLEGYLTCQRLALSAAAEIAAQMAEGWTEKQAADLLGTYLRDYGVTSFFHHPFAWFGDRARFKGFRKYRDFMPSSRALRANEIFILDVAPIYNGHIADIGYTACHGDNFEYKAAMKFLKQLKEKIPTLFMQNLKGREIWEILDQDIREAGYENVHEKYPFGVLGHRVHHNVPHFMNFKFMNFGWQSYWSLLSRGLFGQLLNIHHEGSLVGLWAIEPHIGKSDFGAKFEEILVVEEDKAYWLERSH